MIKEEEKKEEMEEGEEGEEMVVDRDGWKELEGSRGWRFEKDVTGGRMREHVLLLSISIEILSNAHEDEIPFPVRIHQSLTPPFRIHFARSITVTSIAEKERKRERKKET